MVSILQRNYLGRMIKDMIRSTRVSWIEIGRNGKGQDPWEEED